MKGTLYKFFGALFLLLIILYAIPIPSTGQNVEEISLPESKFIEVCGLRVHYVEKPGESNLLLLHGFGASTFSWRYLLESDLGVRVVAFDRPGFGLTERKNPKELPCNPYSPEGAAELTLELMNKLGMEKATLVGHSAGAGIALLVAIKAPERVEKLVLVAPAWEARNQGRLQKFLFSLPWTEKYFPLVLRLSVGRLENILENAWYNKTKLTDEVREGYKKPLKAKDWDKGLFWVTKYSSYPDITEDLSTLSIPALIVHGREDAIVPLKSGEKLHQILPNSKLVVMEKCGHLPHEEKPKEFLDILEEFLKT
ncbi:Alpha/beta hydrolase fold [Thermococcus sp. 2319x1]|uniref:alpha/beta hydrolase n=1 Tax=Thermococcus sp. 2319x1 TaxID=1674923 RepID=UPI00073A9F8D|nr:alpha/beta hydrolase [Thermococcus sp. 2319x1]ALV63192.1 Alpha/beta hydrolase fold [Thermococcus sp. 2319x1]